MKQSTRRFLWLMSAVVATIILSGCAGAANTTPKNATAPAPEKRSLPKIRIGTLPLEDFLPMWVAEQEGMLETAGLDVKYVIFQSAQELVTAMSAGEIDGMTTDMIITLLLASRGTPIKAVSVIQGAAGGIVAGPKSSIKKLDELAGVPIGASSPTSVEYIIDRALADEGISQEDIKIEEIKKIPVRYEMLINGKVAAAAVPWPFFSLAQQQGATPLLDYERASTYSKEVLSVSDAYLTSEGGPRTIKVLMGTWAGAVERINAHPDSYRQLLTEKARLPKEVATSYVIKKYPPTTLPELTMVEDMIDWSLDKGYISESKTYDDIVYQP